MILYFFYYYLYHVMYKHYTTLNTFLLLWKLFKWHENYLLNLKKTPRRKNIAFFCHFLIIEHNNKSIQSNIWIVFYEFYCFGIFLFIIVKNELQLYIHYRGVLMLLLVFAYNLRDDDKSYFFYYVLIFSCQNNTGKKIKQKKTKIKFFRLYNYIYKLQ